MTTRKTMNPWSQHDEWCLNFACPTCKAQPGTKCTIAEREVEARRGWQTHQRRLRVAEGGIAPDKTWRDSSTVSGGGFEVNRRRH
jgi:hypothetical protein